MTQNNLFNTIFICRVIIVVNVTEKDQIMRQIQSDSSFKGVFARSLDRVMYASRIGEIDKHITFCSYLNIPIVMFMRKNFYLTDVFNEKLEILKQAGLIEFWRRNVFGKRSKEPRVLQVITFDQIAGSIHILLLGFTASMIAFFFEIKFNRRI